MKSIFKIALAVSVLTMTLIGCSNENSVNPRPELSTATITGFVYAELDETNAEDETVPAGTKVVAIIDSRELVLDPSNNVEYGLKYYETTVGQDGSYTLEVEVGNWPIEVYIIPADFRFEVETGGDPEERIFEGSDADTDIEVYKGGTFIVDLYY